MNQEQIAEIRRLLAEREDGKPKWTKAEIAAKVGMAYQTLRVRLAEAGFRIEEQLVSIFEAEQQELSGARR